MKDCYMMELAEAFSSFHLQKDSFVCVYASREPFPGSRPRAALTPLCFVIYTWKTHVSYKYVT